MQATQNNSSIRVEKVGLIGSATHETSSHAVLNVNSDINDFLKELDNLEANHRSHWLVESKDQRGQAGLLRRKQKYNAAPVLGHYCDGLGSLRSLVV